MQSHIPLIVGVLRRTLLLNVKLECSLSSWQIYKSKQLNNWSKTSLFSGLYELIWMNAHPRPPPTPPFENRYIFPLFGFVFQTSRELLNTCFTSRCLPSFTKLQQQQQRQQQLTKQQQHRKKYITLLPK